MLPIVICESDAARRAQWMDILSELLRREYPSMRAQLLPGAQPELKRMLAANSGIMLALLSFTASAPGGIGGCIQLYAQVMARNRENYALICLDDLQYLDEVLSHCLRPAGVLMQPLREELTRATLRRVFNDYLSLHDADADGKYLVVSSAGVMQRIACRDILYLEAQNKAVNICLRHRVVSVRGSLNELEQSLPEDFLRVHRSYIVNRRCIANFNAPEMMLELDTQERLPVSRSCKGALVEVLKAEAGGK